MESLSVNSEELWSPVKKLLLLFAMIYVLVYMLPFPFDALEVIPEAVTRLTDSLYLWVGRTILNLPALKKIEFTGSGDTTFDYVKLFTGLILSVIISLVLFAVFFRKQNFSRLYFWTTTYARYYVGLFMVIYGIAKLDGGQFIFPSLDVLDESYGDSSPMGLLWTFMGYSKGYTIFSGIGEIAGGALLLFRKTTIAGCLITLCVMLNVTALNFCYDVPVKLFSSHLVLITAFILAPGLPAVARFFLLQKTALLSYPPLQLPKRWMRITRIVVKSVLFLLFPVLILFQDSGMNEQYHNRPNALNGIYRAEIFTSNNTVLQPLSTDTLRWKTLLLDRHYAQITTMADSSIYYKIDEIDTAQHKISLASYADTLIMYTFHYEKKDGGYMTLTGLYNGDSITSLLKRRVATDYRLVNRGFHWINEYPYNR